MFDSRKFEFELKEKQEQITNLEQLCNKFDMSRIKGKLQDKI